MSMSLPSHAPPAPSEAEQSARAAQDYPHGEPQPLLSEADIERSMQHMCACMIDIGDTHMQIVARDWTRPVTWSEIKVLQEIHGEQAVFDIHPVALAPRESPQREKLRLTLIYGTEVVERVYAGRAFLMEWFMPGWPLDPTKKAKMKKPDRPKAPQYRRPPPDAEATDFRG